MKKMTTIDNILLDEFGPEKILIVRNPNIKLKGFVIVDSSLSGIPMGGVRIAPDITLNETIRLARTMTLKAALYKIPIGGAAAGIRIDPRSEQKKLMIQSFAESIRTLIREDIYYPEPGLGSNDKDIEEILKLSGKPELMPKQIGLFKYDIPLKKTYVGLGVAYCLKTVYEKLNTYKNSKDNMEWNDPPKILLEGFGRAGSELAKHINNLGYSLLGVSTIKGAIFDENGLDIPELLQLKEKYGDNLVNQYESKNLEKIKRDELFDFSADYSIDFIIPGARPDAINKSNIDKIEANAIIPISNIPYDNKILDTLYAKQILTFPEFASNAGDILSFESRKKAKSNVFMNKHIKNRIIDMTIEILERSNEKKIPCYKYAKDQAVDDLKNKKERRKKHIKKLEKEGL